MDYYNKISKGYNELHKEEQLNKIKIIVDNHNFNNKSILDIGCGPAYLLDYLIDNNIKFKGYIGVDPSIKLMKLNKHYNKKIKNIKFINKKIEDFKFKKYNVIVAITSIHHFDISIIKKFKNYANEFIFSILKKSNNFNKINDIIKNNFNIIKKIDEYKDLIYFLN